MGFTVKSTFESGLERQDLDKWQGQEVRVSEGIEQRSQN